MNNKRVLITGSTGMLGMKIIECLKEDKNFEIYGISRKDIISDIYCKNIEMDLTDNNLLKKTIEKIKPNIIIHCAANVNVDSCESDKTYAYKLHVEATKTLASYNPIKTKLIYISTDSVFDGKLGDYNEEDKVNPLNYYAKTKLYGEKIALEKNSNTTIIRTNIYGFHVSKSKSLVEWAIDNLSNQTSINGFTDVYFNPVYVGQLAKIIKTLCNEVNYSGVLNIGSEEYISKYKFLNKLAKVFNYSEQLINKSSIKNIKFDALRPKNTTLNIDKLRKIYNNVPNLELGLLEMKKDLKKCNYEMVLIGVQDGK